MPLFAQEPPAPPPPAPTPEPVIALTAGWLHPVAGPAIENGVLLIQGERILAIGPRDAVAIPADARKLEYPGAHVYPGLIDAQTDAYTDASLRADGSLDAASELAGDLRARGDREDDLAANGITTAWVGSRAAATWRGQGAIVRPQTNGPSVWRNRGTGAVQLRMTAGIGPGHALQRQQMLDGLMRSFDGLDGYKKAFEDHKTALDKYKTDYEAYLAFYRKKQEGEKKDGATPAAPAATPPAGPRPEGTTPPAPGERPRRGRGNQGGNGGGTAAGVDPAPEVAQDPARQEPAKTEPQKQDPAATAPEKKDDKPPAKPEWPKAPEKVPAKDALLRVLDGQLALRVEALRADEIRAALAMARQKNIPILIVEQAYAAATVARELAAAGAACVLTEVLPASLPRDSEPLDPAAAPAALQQAGVAFAIATGSARRSHCLPLMAATAIGRGLDPDAALRAITLTPAELLGIAKDTGSLQVGKLADVLVCDKPLFASDSRVLHVLAAGQTIHEGK